MKRFLCLMLTALMLAGTAHAQAMTMMGFDDTSGRDWTANAFFTRMAERTGVSFELRQYDDRDEYEAALQNLAADMPDVLFRATLTPAQERDLLDDGTLIDLAPLLEENAPNLTALLEANPAWREEITLPDGRIAALPMLTVRERQVGLWINADWLTALGVAMPTTPEELRAALEAIRDGDPNGNGQADEIPLDMTGTWSMKWLLPLFGINADDYNLTTVDGQVVFAPTLDAYRDFVEYLHELYAAGLLREDAFTGLNAMQALEASSDDSSNKTVVSGCFVSLAPYATVGIEANSAYQVIVPASGVWRDLLGCVARGAFAVTSACEDPAAALRWVDYLYTEEGGILATAGVEDEDYVTGEAGWMWQVDNYRTIDMLNSQSLMATSGAIPTPGLTPDDFLDQVDSAVDQYNRGQSERLRAIAALPVARCYLTAEQEAEVAQLQSRLGAAVEMAIGRFATGETELTDETWSAFVQSVQADGEALAAIFQAALDARN